MSPHIGRNPEPDERRRPVKFSTKHYLFLFIALVPAMACYGQEPTPTPTATLQPTPTSTLIVGDLNQDGIVKVEDQLLLMRNWHKRTRPATAEVYSVTITIPNLPSGARPLRLIHIPPGSFLMGERNHPQSNAEPRHQVTLDYGFFIGETEVRKLH